MFFFGTIFLVALFYYSCTWKGALRAGLRIGLAPGSVEWADYEACNWLGGRHAVVNDELRREYSSQGASFLLAQSVVVDIGGYVGDAMQNVYDNYNSRIFIFEPVVVFASHLETRFAYAREKVAILNYGIGARDENVSFVIRGEASHIGHEDGHANAQFVTVRMRTLDSFFELLEQRHDARYVDLFHINCEGCEYSVLEYLVSSPWILRIRNLLIQFHANSVDNAIDRRCALRTKLARTHRIAWDRPFIWERWELAITPLSAAERTM